MDLVGPPGAGTAGGLRRVKSPRAHADAARMATLLERLLRRSLRRSDPAPSDERANDEADVQSIEAALAQAEDIAARTTALASDLHRLLTRDTARRRTKRPEERILH